MARLLCAAATSQTGMRKWNGTGFIEEIGLRDWGGHTDMCGSLQTDTENSFKNMHIMCVTAQYP
jgi:hypothetical protein